jgi:hypothetical protein
MPDRISLQPLTLPSCANCRYCAADPDLQQAAVAANLKAPDQGICVRYPPQSQLVGTPQGPMSVLVKTVVPLTHWCGEHAPRSA